MPFRIPVICLGLMIALATIALSQPGTRPYAGSGPVKGPRTRPATQPTTRPSDEILVKVLRCGVPKDVEKLYPGLKAAAIAWARQWNNDPRSRPATESERAAQALLLRTVLDPTEHRELCRYLGYWFASRRTFAGDIGYKPVPTPATGRASRPERAAYVVFRGAREHLIMAFTWEPAAKAATQPSDRRLAGWEDRDMCGLVTGPRMGAAIAIIQDALIAARDGKAISVYSVDGKLGWRWDKPVSWRLVEQKGEGEYGIGFYLMEMRLDEPKGQRLRMGVRFKDKKDKELGLDVHLVRSDKLRGHMGWRIRRIDQTASPSTGLE